MNWLIVSTIGKNPGDEFIKCGVRNIIKRVDKHATGQVVDKETRSIHVPHEFDKCIWAGMPVFWSLHDNTSWNVPWWNVLTRGWVSESKHDFCVLGAGSFQDWNDCNRGLNRDKMQQEAALLNDRAHAVVVRDPVVRDITNMQFPVKVCPAILANYNTDKTASVKACNLMPRGAHYTQFNATQHTCWLEKQRQVAAILLSNNFMFFAHNDEEYNHAINLGWNVDTIVNYKKDTNNMLEQYRNVDKYFGNRVHGCIVSRANGADVISCGYDSRQEAVRLSGARVLTPEQLDLNLLSMWAESEPKTTCFDLDSTMDWYCELMSEFIKK